MILEQTLARIATSQYKIYLMFPDSHKEHLVRLEKRLKGEYPEIYQFVKNPAIKLLRKTGYVSFGLVGAVARRVMR